MYVGRRKLHEESDVPAILIYKRLCMQDRAEKGSSFSGVFHKRTL